MKPLKLTLEAFGSYNEKTVIDFRKNRQNLFLVAGNTGAGKTTIFDALVFALYGEASSGRNRKSGAELQSQFGDYTVSPMVELEFLKIQGTEELRYVVRRSPKHRKLVVKGKNKGGYTDKAETVSLILPDGSEFSQNNRETDARLTEIIGLTKDQFMQVGMIAQGEFMEVLRAKSDDKKQIFRRLFNTGLYQEILEALTERRREAEGETAKLEAAIRAELSHLVIPSGTPEFAELAAAQKNILTADFSVSEFENLLTGLQELVKTLTEKLTAAKTDAKTAQENSDKKRDAYTAALELMKSFERLKAAEGELSTYAAQAAKMQGAPKLIENLRAAYEIKGLHANYQDAANKAKDTAKRLRQQQEALPKLQTIAATAATDAKTTATAQEKAATALATVTEAVTKELSLRAKIKQDEQEIKKGKEKLAVAEKELAASKKSLQDLQTEEERYRKEREELKDLPTTEMEHKHTLEALQKLAADVAEISAQQTTLKKQKAQVQTTAADYKNSRRQAASKGEFYQRLQEQFFDEQAGYLAQEKLHDGEPCPVCGSLDHPSPCAVTADKAVTREAIDKARAEHDKARSEQEKAAANMAKAETDYTKGLEDFKERGRKLRAELKKVAAEVPDSLTPREAAQILSDLQEALAATAQELQKKKARLQAAEKFLAKVTEKRAALQDKLEAAQEAVKTAQTELAASESQAQSRRAEQKFPDEATAKLRQRTAEEQKKTADAKAQQAATAKEKAQAALGEAWVLIKRCQTDLPEEEGAAAKRHTLYQERMAARDLAETEWQELIAKYDADYPDKLQAELTLYLQKRDLAEGRKAAALEAIGGRDRPEVEALAQAKDKAAEELTERQKAVNELKEAAQSDRRVLAALKEKEAARNLAKGRQIILNGLYNRLAGKVSGARMDIETFVQRYYLKQILAAANRRFQSMSLGQYELRMVPDAEAGAGKNRGLDLMVYSTVTQKEREIRTLSGGESFMAALSMALGMADEIESAAISLDIMFIDEGFGSLDDYARNQAVKVLQNVSASRLIGIISHVEELKQAIESKLMVTKDERGSHARWEIS